MILITGCAGFIGFHLSKLLLEKNYKILGVDNLNDYYDVNLKKDRLEILKKNENFKFVKSDIESAEFRQIMLDEKPEYIVNLAAQAGVRYSLTNPEVYIKSNIDGFLNILEASRIIKPKHVVYASSSSVYGLNTQRPFSEKHNVDHPVSMYAATKKANELMAHTYSHLFKIPTTGLRFFTVYGPWGRPDMALFLFTKAILDGNPIEVFNNGNMERDFTYIDNIIDGIFRLLFTPPQGVSGDIDKTPDKSSAPYRIYNIGNNQPVKLMYFIECIEKALEKKAIIDFKPMQPGDVEKTYADIDSLSNDFGYNPKYSIEEGINEFVAWYREYYKKQ